MFLSSEMSNGILRKRFLRELAALKRMTDYSSCDPSNLSSLLHGLGPGYGQYAYSMIQSGIDSDNIHYITDQHLLEECGITNAIHRNKILEHIQSKIIQ